MKKRARRTRPKSETFKYLRFVIAGILIVAFVFWCVKVTVSRIKDADHFHVKAIEIDPGISFVKSPTLQRLKGKSIFDVDLQKVQNKLRHQYPQLASLRVIKRFPDRIHVVARERNAFAQMILRRRQVTIDSEGVILYSSDDVNVSLPLIRGVTYKDAIRPGQRVRGQSVQIAINIIKMFHKSNILSRYPNLNVDVSNLSKINLTILDNLRIIIDREKIHQKLKILELLLTQGKVDVENVRYVDLRFKEPIIRKK